MTITRADVADLKPGDVVEYSRAEWPEGTVVRGPLKKAGGVLYILDGYFGVVESDGSPYEEDSTLTVISRAKPPLYVNSDKTEPDPGDVVTTVPEEDGYEVIPGWQPTWCFTQHKVWIGTFTGTPIKTAMPDELRLLVDGRTGQVVL